MPAASASSEWSNLKRNGYNQKYVIAKFYPDYKSDTYIPFTITLQPIMNLTPKNADPIDRIIAAFAEAAKNGDKYFVYNQPPRIGN